MALVIVNQGEERILNRALFANFTLRLFTNDVTAGLTPGQIEVLTEADFTEATFTGYVAADLDLGTWTVTEGDPTFAVNALKTFTRSATGTAQTVFGYWVTDDTDGALQWFEEFEGGPITVTNLGDAITVLPRVTLDDQEDISMFARGVIAREALTVNSTSYSTDVDTDMNLNNVPVVAGRIYAIEIDSPYSIGGAAQWAVNVKINGALFGRLGWLWSDGSENGHITGRVWWEPTVTASTDDIVVALDEIAGAANVTLNGSSNAQRVLSLIDYGLAP